MSEAPPPPSSPQSGSGPELHITGPVDPATQVKLPSTLMIVYAALLAVVMVLAMLLNMLGTGLSVMKNNDMFGAAQGVVGIVLNIFNLVVAVIIVVGAINMMRLKKYGLAMTASVLVMIPCSCCCIVGLPLGIWSLVVLMKPEVKAAFGATVAQQSFPVA